MTHAAPATAKALIAMRDAGLWNGSFANKESTLQQLAPYVGKLKSGLVRTLIEHFTSKGQWVCDPFCGSGVVPLEALLLGRRALANDLNSYAYTVTRGKLEAPATESAALKQATYALRFVHKNWKFYDLRSVAPWVREFFHSRTLKETLACFDYCAEREKSFLFDCLCGILHHQRPGFLSYPASHTIPYLRTALFPRDTYPDLYMYRPLNDRLKAKITRTYKRVGFTTRWRALDYRLSQTDARSLSFRSGSADLILTSPPYYDTLDYARDNRLRLWFLGETDWWSLDRQLISRASQYTDEMTDCFREMTRVLKRGRHCIVIVGEAQRNGRTRDTGSILGRLAAHATEGELSLDCVVTDDIPATTINGTVSRARVEQILVFRKQN